MRVLRGLRPYHFLKCAGTTERARAEQISDLANFIEDGVGVRTLGDIPGPPARGEGGRRYQLGRIYSAIRTHGPHSHRSRQP